MNINFPITAALNRDSDIIRSALNSRALELKKQEDAQGIITRVTIVAVYILKRATIVVTIACLPLSALTFSIVTPVSIAVTSAILFWILHFISGQLQVRNPDETSVKECWKLLFTAIRVGQGAKIVQTCKDVFAQKKGKRNTVNTAYHDCLGNSLDVDPFLYKTSMIGHLLIALEHVAKRDFDKAHTSVEESLKLFGKSGFSEDVEKFAKAINKNPEDILMLMRKHPAEIRLQSLDHWISMRKSMAIEELSLISI